jgi:hypothetical protein
LRWNPAVSERHAADALTTTLAENPMESTKPRQDRSTTEKPHSQEGSVKHVVRTGLPPGIDVEDVKDPGKVSPKGPADNRS